MENKSIDYFTYEEAMARAERHVKRWMLATIIVFVVLVLSNIGWIVYAS